MRRAQHFGVGVLVTVFFPMLPLGIELKFAGGISEASIYIASVMYVSAISLAYENILIFYSGILSAIWLAVEYGAVLVASTGSSSASLGVPACMIAMFGMVQIFKCFDVHITQGQNFIYFPRV